MQFGYILFAVCAAISTVWGSPRAQAQSTPCDVECLIAAGHVETSCLASSPYNGSLADRNRDIADCIAARAGGGPNPQVAAELGSIANGYRQREARLRKPGATIGMTAQQVENDTSWGHPDHINRTVTATGERHQWVYPGGFLYFENGRLVAIQTQNE